MEINSVKANEISSYIKDDGGCLQHNKLLVQLKGQPEPLHVFRLPIELLIYNKRNGRFAAEITQKQKELGRELDPLEEEDRKIIKELLLEEDENATQLLRENLIKVGQLYSGIITFDGVVINGNRRMAIFEDLFEEKSDPKYSFLTAARLPPNVDEKDIYRLEIGLQLSRAYREDYGPINDLLKVKEGVKIGFTSKEIANSIFGGSESKIKEKLERLKLIEDYLEYIGKPKQYEEVKGWHEHFIDLQKGISTLKNKKMGAEEIYSATIAGFELIIARVPHMDIRKIRDLMSEKKTKEGLMESVEKVIEDKTSIEEKIKKEPKKLIKKKKTKSPTKIAKEFKEDFESLKDAHRARKEADKPKTLLKRALGSLESINPKHSKLKDPEIIDILKNITVIVKKLLGTK
ncbi:MAG: hypothetical protein IB616_01245 [Methanosarcinales archaeon]|nr:MAG: hypothetical protein IB616_01245 [Methanosarcinales archaeon]